MSEDEELFNPTFLTSILELDIEKCSLQSLNEGLGMGGRVRILNVELRESVQQVFVLKFVGNDSVKLSQTLGLAREALFYKNLAPSLLSQDLPKIFYAEGDMSTGKELIIMEDLLDSVQTGYFFGSGNPMNWGKDIEGQISKAGRLVSPESIIEAAFKIAARLHGQYWNDAKLLDFSWLRGCAWARGLDRPSWEAAQAEASNAWKRATANLKPTPSPQGEVFWSKDVLALIAASIARASWDDFQLAQRSRPWTLAHGDFHPGNMLLASAASAAEPPGRLVLLDWELVGVGSGPQDLGQYMISHATPAVRRGVEQRMVREYYQFVAASGPAAVGYSWDSCWAEYVAGGVERWVWLLAYLAGSGLPAAAVQFFHDQLAAFAGDHGVTADKVGMPRV